MSNLYLICDEKNGLMRTEGVMLMGRMVAIPAIFYEEQDALETLYAIETLKLTETKQAVRKVGGSIMVSGL